MTDELNETFIVAQQFELYLEKSNLKQAEMSDVQYIETRRAFYAGSGQMLLLTGKIEQVRIDEGLMLLDKVLAEVQA